MRILDKFKKKNEQESQTEKNVDNDLLEIIKIISCNNADILASAQECVDNIAQYYKNHIEDYEDRGISSDEEASFLRWIGCIDLLINSKIVCECDWKEEKSGFVSGISSLRGIVSLALKVDSRWFDEEQEIPQWCEILDEKWKNSDCVVAAFDIDSDSYVMFPCKITDIKKLSELADGVGYRIDYAKNM